MTCDSAHKGQQDVHCHPNRGCCPFQGQDSSHSSVILVCADVSISVTAWWTEWEGAGPAKHELNYLLYKVYSYPDEFLNPLHCMTVPNSCPGRREQIVQGPKQVVEEESGWDWFLWKQYLLMPKAFTELQALHFLITYPTPPKDLWSLISSNCL